MLDSFKFLFYFLGAFNLACTNRQNQPQRIKIDGVALIGVMDS
ncbi:MAG: hypothetical protein CM15mP32_6230 [Flavobacteriaceae bacterium]|nr:MAG: hypothetical protein CM15mP32_6230 [Flavobacteriaceae bacterium]